LKASSSRLCQDPGPFFFLLTPPQVSRVPSLESPCRSPEIFNPFRPTKMSAPAQRSLHPFVTSSFPFQAPRGFFRLPYIGTFCPFIGDSSLSVTRDPVRRPAPQKTSNILTFGFIIPCGFISGRRTSYYLFGIRRPSFFVLLLSAERVISLSIPHFWSHLHSYQLFFVRLFLSLFPGPGFLSFRFLVFRLWILPPHALLLLSSPCPDVSSGRVIYRRGNHFRRFSSKLRSLKRFRSPQDASELPSGNRVTLLTVPLWDFSPLPPSTPART